MMREALPGHLGAASTGTTNKKGTYVARNLVGGRYAARLMDSSGTYYDFKWVTVPDQRRVEFSPDVVHVIGTITLGGDPLRAKIWFGGQHAEVSNLLESDKKGHFSGILPRAGDWTVEVHSKSRRVDSRIVGVEVKKRADGRSTEVDLAVPDTELQGRTIDSSGVPVGGAFVVFYQPAKKTSFYIRGDSDGSFEVRGIAKGQIWVSAQARDKSGGQLSAPQQSVQVMKKHTNPSPVLLILSKAMRIKGRVLHPSGQPEIGAQIIAFALDHGRFSSPVSLKAVTRADGSFQFRVPSKTDRLEVFLEPPGAGALRATSAGDLKRTKITLTSELDGGELRVAYPPTYKPGSSKSAILLLYQNGHPIFWPILSDWAHAHGEITGRNVTEQTIPAM
ncbi:MAG TPA: carboxypeptidase-like regulatory domain-containing protein, partial [Candidatus Krumholzibacteria bacterium]|nr:carboxypeptidase-like regulatory domain-containing protein [Candidatus Krumholzibacteria bacterium]